MARPTDVLVDCVVVAWGHVSGSNEKRLDTEDSDVQSMSREKNKRQRQSQTVGGSREMRQLVMKLMTGCLGLITLLRKPVWRFGSRGLASKGRQLLCTTRPHQCVPIPAAEVFDRRLHATSTTAAEDASSHLRVLGSLSLCSSLDIDLLYITRS